MLRTPLLTRIYYIALAFVGLSIALSQGCAITSNPPPAGQFACKSDLDCLADQICTGGKCINQANRPIVDSGNPPPPPPPDQPPIDFGLPPSDSGTDAPPLPDEISPPDEKKPDTKPGCAAGTRAPCYQGPKGTSGVGACKRGITVCNDEGQWGPCEGQVLPKKEVCEDNIDNNCNGQVDESCGECNNGERRTCYTGPPRTRSVGTCKNGTQLCQGGSWGGCQGEVLPTNEKCNDNLDNDCDGRADENCNGNCPEGQQRPCYSGFKGCTRTNSGSYTCKGECKAGLQRCVNGSWSACQGDAKDSPERCDGKDNDCDGTPDNNPKDVGTPCKIANQKGACAAGKSRCSGGKIICDQVVQPIAEKCDNGVDDDCDGSVDEGCMATVVILTSITPNSTPRAGNFNASLKGTGFTTGIIVQISPGNTPTPSYNNISNYGGKIDAITASEVKISFAPLASALKEGTYLIRVVAPGNIISNSVFLTLTPANTSNGVTITSLVPNTADAGKAYSGVFTGTNFKVGATVELRAPIVGQWVKLNLLGGAVSILRTSSTSLTMSISNVPATFNGISLKGAHDVRIINTDGTFSNAVKFTIR